MKLRYFSHSAFQITADSGEKILIDPFFTGNPTSPVDAPGILPQSSGFEAETEILINASENELLCSSIPIPTIYNDSVSKMQSIPAILGFIKVILR